MGAGARCGCVLLAAALVPLVAVFARVEAARLPATTVPGWRAVGAAAAITVAMGLLARHGFAAPGMPAGLPVVALGLLGAGWWLVGARPPLAVDADRPPSSAALAVLTVHNLGVERLRRRSTSRPARDDGRRPGGSGPRWAGSGPATWGCRRPASGTRACGRCDSCWRSRSAGLVPGDPPPVRRPPDGRRRALGTAYRAAVRIPLGTVLVEEVAFRGVLLAMLGGHLGVGWAVAVSSHLFGLWHVVPVRATMRTNGFVAPAPARGRDRGRRSAVVGGGLVLAAAGDRWTGGAALVHASAGAATVVAFFAVRRATASTRYSDRAPGAVPLAWMST